MTNIPKITPYDHTQWKCKQSKYEMVSELPTRALLVAPSNSGKSVLLQNLILDIYKKKMYLNAIINSIWLKDYY